MEFLIGELCKTEDCFSSYQRSISSIRTLKGTIGKSGFCIMRKRVRNKKYFGLLKIFEKMSPSSSRYEK